MFNKSILYLSLAATLTLPSLAVAQEGMQFAEGSWQEILDKAKAENKLVFLDAYTTWCGPCKMMARNTFTDAEVGAFYNANFINAKFDMEKGEGIDLASRYQVQAYPTLLYIKGDGTLAHRALGYHEPDQFLAVGRDAINPAKNLAGLDARYQAGDRGAEFMQQYLAAKSAAQDPETGIIAKYYLQDQEDWNNPTSRQVIFDYVDDWREPAFQYLLDNRDAFTEQFGPADLEMKLDYALNSFVQEYGIEPEVLEPMVIKLYGEETGREKIALINLLVAQQSGDMDAFAKAAIHYLDKYPTEDPGMLNEIAWMFYLNIDDKTQLKSALGWALKSAEIDEGYYNRDTVAALYYKLGDKKNARTNAKKAIALAKASGEDYTETQNLLDKIDKKK